MKFINNIKFGGGVLIVLNLLLAFGTIWVFVRMSPAIETIIEQNERSLFHCEQMLALLDENHERTSAPGVHENDKVKFLDFLTKAENNITEKDENPPVETIKANYENALEGDSAARKLTLGAIIKLSEINRNAMFNADAKAKQLGNAGAWGVVFMAAAVFTCCLLFIRKLQYNLIQPLEEIHTTVNEYKDGETMRRCTGTNLPSEIQNLYNSINDLLDKINLHR